MECDFCNTELKESVSVNCSRCGFPIHGTNEEKEKFRSENEKLEQLIGEADSALSWARFGMLWPWLTAIVVAGSYFLRPPVEVTAFFATLTISSFFIFCYFAVIKSPIASLTGAFVFLIMLTAFALYQFYELLSFGIYWTPFIIPVILLMMFGNALYLMKKLEKRLNEKNN